MDKPTFMLVGSNHFCGHRCWDVLGERLQTFATVHIYMEVIDNEDKVGGDKKILSFVTK